LKAILVGMGLEHKTVDVLTTELELPANQLLALFNRSIRKLSAVLRGVLEQEIESRIGEKAVGGLELGSLDLELEIGAKEEEAKQREKAKAMLVSQDLTQYIVKGSEKDWSSALAGGKTINSLSIKTGEKRAGEETEENESKKKKENKEPNQKKKKKKDKKK